MFNHLLTFVIFLLIGVEIREGLKNARSALLPSLAALGGMIFPAIIFSAIDSTSGGWAVAMPTDVALAVGALSLLGRKVNPAIRLFLLTLAVADDLFSLIAMAIFFRSDLDFSSAFYTLGAALIGFLLPSRDQVLKYLAPTVTFVVIPIYIWINLFAEIELSALGDKTSIALIFARVIGKVLGISLVTWFLIRFTKLRLPKNLDFREVVGVGFLSGMGMTVSLVIADITLRDTAQISAVRGGLFIAALISALLGIFWLKVVKVNLR